jgi:hypothetical protein
LGLACYALLASRAPAAGDNDTFKVNIRTEVDREWTLFSKKPAVVHSKLYSLAWIKRPKRTAAGDLANPVDETALLQQLHDVLAARGFHEPEAGKVPDVVLTVLYGRSKLKNPYDDGAIAIADAGLGGGGTGQNISGGGENYGSNSSGSTAGASEEVTGGIDLMMAERTPGFKEKKMAADEEKVFISITAWEFPGFMPKAKPKMLWRATMNVDDPTLDLNVVGGKMLALGAPYFDREIKDKEITVSGSLADAAPPKSSLSDTDTGSGKSMK